MGRALLTVRAKEKQEVKAQRAAPRDEWAANTTDTIHNILRGDAKADVLSL